MNFYALFGGAAGHAVLRPAAGGAMRVRALIRPLGPTARTGRSGIPSPAGRLDESCRLYLGGPEYSAARLEGAAVDFDGKRYRAERAENVYFGRAILYVRAVLRPTGEEEGIG